jgi:predicted RNA-binding protein YlxR (DUF448 family)
MKSKEEIEQLAFLKYPRLINDNPLCRNPNNPMEDDNTYERKIWIGAYTQCQEDMADKKYTERQLRDAMEEAMVFNKLKQITEYIISINKQD